MLFGGLEKRCINVLLCTYIIDSGVINEEEDLFQAESKNGAKLGGSCPNRKWVRRDCRADVTCNVTF